MFIVFWVLFKNPKYTWDGQNFNNIIQYKTLHKYYLCVQFLLRLRHGGVAAVLCDVILDRITYCKVLIVF